MTWHRSRFLLALLVPLGALTAGAGPAPAATDERTRSSRRSNARRTPYGPWNPTETPATYAPLDLMIGDAYLALITWMRAYNREHPADPVRFMGDDLGWAGPELYDRVTDHVADAHPALLPRGTEPDRGLRPAVPAGEYMTRQYMSAPLAERQERAVRTGRALELLREPPGADREAVEAARLRDR
ncbi:erythromycin esterase family protein [Streptomyces sp. NPDC002845]